MPLRISRRWFVGGSLLAPSFPRSAPARPLQIEQAFLSPPDEARPWTYWFWLNGNVTREGVTADLEAMHSAGIRGVIMMSIDGKGTDPGPVRFLSPLWHEMLRHVATEADRLGITVDMNNDDGWNSGGPWITPELAMQKMVWTETGISGPQKFTGKLPQPQTKLDYYRDIAVIAFPSPPRDERKRSLVVTAAGKPSRPAVCELQVSDDGTNFRPVRRFDTGWGTGIGTYDSITIALPEVSGARFRLQGFELDGKPAANFKFSLSETARVDLWEIKAGFAFIHEHGGGSPMLLNAGDLDRQLASGAWIRRASVLDLSSHMDPSSRFAWDVPPGDWTILRIGYTPTGASNGPATPEGKGLDCDKMSRAAIEAQFAGMVAKLPGLKFVHNDSWEAGAQNWTAALRQEFRRRRGYDLLPFLPAMAGGYVVESDQISERFLWDLRRTLADLISENYWGRLGELCHAHGMQYSIESAGRQQFLYDPLDYFRTGDLPMGELWTTEERPRPDCKLAASAGHLYGKPVVGAEAFTCTGGPGGEWKAHPFWLKARGDEAFCHGVNRLVFHRYVHQPYLDRKPGLHWATVGTQLERTQTWWNAMPAWTTYLARCQFLLQQGHFVADACYLTGEGAPNALVRARRRPPLAPEGQDASTTTLLTLGRRHELPPQLPEGYDFDGCNRESLMRMTVRDGRLISPGGMSYRLLVLPVETTMTPALIRKISELVEAGATVGGPKPRHAPGLTGYPTCDDEVRQIADELWDRGKVIWGKPLAEVLASLNVAPDFEYAPADADLDYIHRKTADADIYFVANQKQTAEQVQCSFRAGARQPELWYPDTGRIVRPAVYSIRGGRTALTLRFDPAGSVFVVFRDPVRIDPVAAMQPDAEIVVSQQGKLNLLATRPGMYRLRTASGKTMIHSVPGPLPSLTIDGPWELRFPAGWGAPDKVDLQELISWAGHPDNGVRHFSGSATYIKEFRVAADAIRPNLQWILDLGEVKEIAEVSLNGKTLGTLWKPPFQCEISEALRPANRLEIRVTNLWPNRLIGDMQLPEKERYTWTNSNPYRSDSPLLVSGLLGPVRLYTIERAVLPV